MCDPLRFDRYALGRWKYVCFGVALHACSGTPTPPTPGSEALRISCPAPLSLSSPRGQPLAVTYGIATAAGGTPPTIVSCVPPSGATFAIGFSTVSCAVTDQTGRTESCAFSITLVAPPRVSVARFLAFGDSITWGEDGRNPPASMNSSSRVRPHVQLPAPDTYPGALQSRLAERYTAQSPEVTNAGLPGEVVVNPATLSRFVGFISSGAFDAVLLMEGANDLANDNVPAVMTGLGRMIDEATSRRMRVLLATIPPENPAASDPKSRGLQAAKVAPFNDQVRLLAASKSVPLVDVYQAFGSDLTLIGGDGLHPNAAGYRAIADAFFASIKQTLELPAEASAMPSPMLTPFVRRWPL